MSAYATGLEVRPEVNDPAHCVGHFGVRLRPSPPTDAAESVCLKLLDGFELSYEGRVIVMPLATQRLVAFLALHTQPLRRPYVAGKLWFEKTEGNAHACLRSALWRLRACCPASLVESTRAHIWIGPASKVDVREQVSLARRLLDPSAEMAQIDHQTVLQGDLLPGWYDEWVLLEREHLRQLRLHALEALAERLAVKGRYGEAVETAFAAVLADPLRESAQRILIKIHVAEGNLSEALRQYRQCRELLHRKLGVEPSSELQALIEVIAGPEQATDGQVLRKLSPASCDAGVLVTPRILSANSPGPCGKVGM